MKNEESKLQQNCVKWFRYQFPEPKYLIYANANGGQRNVITAKIMKGEGVRAGVPDLTILSQGHIFFVEMKSEKGRLSENQKEVIEIIDKLGFKTYVVNSFDQFMDVCNKELMK